MLTRKEIIAAAKDMDPDRFPCVCDELHEACIAFWMNGVHDDSAGSVDCTGHIFRVENHTVETDGYGFTRLTSHETIEDAQAAIDEVSELEFEDA